MTQRIVVNNNYKTTQTEIKSIIDNFDLIDDYIAKGTRNSIKKKKLESGKIATIKSFDKEKEKIKQPGNFPVFLCDKYLI